MDRMTAMETFVSVVDAGSFSAAARRLKLGQPAVSKAIAQLEERLGVRLLLRSTRGLAPTDAGQRFYEHARRAIDEADQAEQVVRESSDGLSGRLRISAAVTFARLHVLPALKTFLDQHPKLSIDIVLDDRSIDLLEQGVESWSFRGDDGSEVAVAVSGRVSVSAAEGVRTAVLGHMGLAVASEWMFLPELADGTVQAVLNQWTLPPIDVWAVFPSGRMATSKARAFVAFVEHLFEGYGGNTPVGSESKLVD